MEQQLHQARENGARTRDIANRKKEQATTSTQKEGDPKETETIEEEKKENE